MHQRLPENRRSIGTRLLTGLAKGLLLGAGIGALFHLILHWPVTSGLLGHLVAMGAGATAGLLAGRPPWRRHAWLEGALKAAAGLGFGALVYWLIERFVPIATPIEALGIPIHTPWIHVTALNTTLVSSLFGVLVELDS